MNLCGQPVIIRLARGSFHAGKNADDLRAFICLYQIMLRTCDKELSRRIERHLTRVLNLGMQARRAYARETVRSGPPEQISTRVEVPSFSALEQLRGRS